MSIVLGQDKVLRGVFASGTCGVSDLYVHVPDTASKINSDYKE